MSMSLNHEKNHNNEKQKQQQQQKSVPKQMIIEKRMPRRVKVQRKRVTFTPTILSSLANNDDGISNIDNKQHDHYTKSSSSTGISLSELLENDDKETSLFNTLLNEISCGYGIEGFEYYDMYEYDSYDVVREEQEIKRDGIQKEMK